MFGTTDNISVPPPDSQVVAIFKIDDVRNGGYVDVDICSPFYEKKEIKECDMT